MEGKKKNPVIFVIKGIGKNLIIFLEGKKQLAMYIITALNTDQLCTTLSDHDNSCYCIMILYEMVIANAD